MNHTETTPLHVVLVPGYWLGAWAWGPVEAELRSAGLTTHAVTLPGLDGTTTAGITLDDHIGAVTELVDSLDGDVVLVGHSGGSLVVQGVTDRRPERIRRVVYVDGGPLLDGVSLHPDAGADIDLPTWEELEAEGSSLEGLDDESLARFRERAVPHPGGVAASPIRVHDERRLDVPTSVICTSLPSPVLLGMIEAGDMPSELLAVRDVHLVDLPTGHWPMFSRPADLAGAIHDELTR